MRIKLAAFLLLISTFIAGAQTSLTIEGKTYNNTDDTWLGVNIARDVKTKLIFKNNTITSINRYGYLLQAGDESKKPTNNNLDGAVITGNKFNWSGTDMKVIPHGLFTGHNSNIVAKYNYLNNVPMGIIRKSTTNMSNTGGGVAYNIVKNGAVGIVVKGMSNVNIYNNTLYTDRTPSQTWRPLVHIYTNTDAGGYSVAHGTKIYNNIFYTKYETFAITIDDTESLKSLECDYNVYWCESGSPKFYIAGSVKTFAQWQAMGYDKHSVVVNPQFKDLVNFVPSKRLDYGKDLGTEWKDGLATTAKWGTADPATAAQNGTWQAGAVVYAGTGTPAAEVPVYTGSVISNSSPAVVEMTYSLQLAGIIPPATAFTVKVNSVQRSVTRVAVSGTKVMLTMASPATFGDAVTVAYTKPASDPLQTSSGGFAVSLAAQAVVNSIVAVSPVFVSSAAENATPSMLDITFNLDLAAVVPVPGAFTVKVNGAAGSISSVSVSGKKVSLTLSSGLKNTDVVTVSYNKPAANPLQSLQGAMVESFSDKPVLNNISKSPETPADPGPADDQKKITVSPNPASGFIKIENLEATGQKVVRIYTFTGKLVKEMKFDSGSSLTVPLDLNSGMYFVQVEMASVTRHMQKFIIVK